MSHYDLQKAQEYFHNKISFTTGVHELEGIIQRGPNNIAVIDVRLPSDYAKAHVPGAVNLPKGKWETARGLRKDGINYLYCYNQTCHLAAEAAVVLTGLGYKVVEVEGGWAAWETNGYRVEHLAQTA